MAITGPVGVGKTTVVRSYLADHENELMRIIYIFNSNTSFADLMETIYQELDITTVPSSNISQMVGSLHLFLIDEYKAGHTIVLIVDEAQNMPLATLENLRMLSNLETAENKLIQIVLVGQPELDELLDKYELRQLKQRIAMRSTINPLTKEESMAYIAHRLARAGAQTTSIFTKMALHKIVKEARGIPRNINTLCDNALITACGYEAKMVSPRVINEVVADLNGRQLRHLVRPYLTVSAIFLCLFAILVLAFRYGYLGWPVDQKPTVTAMKESTVSSINHIKEVRMIPENDPVAAKDRVVTQEETKPQAMPTKKGDGQIGADLEQMKIIAKRTVKVGDCLSSLTKDVYGQSANEFLELVKDNNPDIKNVHILRTGSVVNFPELPRNLKSRREGLHD